MGNSIVYVVLTVSLAIFASISAPLLLLYLTARQRRVEKAEDYRRQDEVARVAEERAAKATLAATEVATQAREAARLLLDVNDRVAKTAKGVDAKLDVIHTLVNSNLTAALQAEYDALATSHALMGELIALRRENGTEPTDAFLAALAETSARMVELGEILADRHAQQEKANALASTVDPSWINS